MKTKILVMSAVIGMALLTSLSYAQTPPTTGGGGGVSVNEESLPPVGTVNSEEVARLIASKGITEFRGTFAFDRIIGTQIPGCNGTDGFSSTTGQSCAGNTTSRTRIKGTFRLWYGRIINLVINGVEIPDDQDRYTLPVNNVGTVRDFRLTVEGVNERERVLFGEFNTYELQPGQKIQIVLRPFAVPFFLAYKPGDDINAANLNISIQNGTDWYGSSYDERRGGFSVWLTPGVATLYRIYDGENNTIETGFIDTNRLVAIPSEEPILGISVLGNVAYSLNGWFSQGGLQMDSTIVNGDGTTQVGKVIAYNNGEGKRLRIGVQGLYPGSMIVIKKVDEEMTVIDEFKVPDDGIDAYTTFITSGIVESVIVTVTGGLWNEERGFVLNLNALHEDVPIVTPVPVIIEQ